MNGIPQKYLNQLVKVSYNAKVSLTCRSQNVELLTFINTTLDLDHNFLNGLSPYLFISANITITLTQGTEVSIAVQQIEVYTVVQPIPVQNHYKGH